MIIIYSKDNCPKCNMAKQLAEENGIEHSIVKIGFDISREEFMETFPAARSAPYIVKTNESDGAVIVGGFEQLQEMYKGGLL
jgi:glutaredoxin